jgi:multiple sugar transport system ATP-binding protein
MASITLKNVSKRYGKNQYIIKNLSLEIPDKAFAVIVGPSGCGKTSVLRMIAGLEEITDGEIFIGEKKVNNLPPKDRDIAMVFQNYALYPHMNVYENMAFGLKMRKMPKTEIQKRVKETAQLLGIQDYLDRKPKELSGGQRQRVAMGRAIVREPKVFLMDEPLSNLDSQFRVQMRAELKKLHERLGITTLYVTHDQTEAITLGSLIVVLKDGVIQQADTPLALYEKPANTFVATFIGSPSMNLFSANISAEGENLFLQIEKFRLPVASEKKSLLRKYIGQEILVGIRPEDFCESVVGDAKAFLEADVELLELMGADRYLHGYTGKERLTARLNAQIPIKTSEKIRLFFNPSKIYFFEKESGKAIFPAEKQTGVE